MNKIASIVLIPLFFIGCGEDKLHLFRLQGDIRKGWIRIIKNDSLHFAMEGAKIALDNVGNCYIASSFSDTIDFDPGSDKHKYSSSGGDGFVAKFDKFGNFCWVNIFECDDLFFIKDIKIDNMDNIYLCGFWEGSFDADPRSKVEIHTSNGGDDAFVLKLDNKGDLLWARTFGGSSAEKAISIVIDSEGGSHIVGSFCSTVDFDPGVATHFVTASGDYDGFVLHLDKDGVFQKVFTLGSVNTVGVHGISIDSTDNCYIIGHFSGTVDFAFGSKIENRTAVGPADNFLLKISSDYHFCWVNTYVGLTTQFVALLQDDFCYTTGVFRQVVDFDSGSGVQNRIPNSSQDAFVLKVNCDNGSYLWVNTFAGGGSSTSLAFDSFGSYYLSGSFRGKMDFDPSSYKHEIEATSQNGFVVKMDSTDRFCSVNSLGGTSFVKVLNSAVDNRGYCFIVGTYNVPIGAGDNSCPYFESVTNGFGFFVVKLPRQ